MSSDQHLREFIRERLTSLAGEKEFIKEKLTAAAAEIFTEVEKTIVRHEEELDAQRRMMGINWKPEMKLNRMGSELQGQSSDLQKPHVYIDGDASANQQFCNKRRRLCHDQEESEPPRIKEEELELPCIKEEEQEIPCIKVEEQELPSVKKEEQELPSVKKEEQELPSVKKEEQELPSVKKEEQELPSVKKEEQELPSVKKEEQEPPSVKKEEQELPCIKEDKPEPTCIKEEELKRLLMEEKTWETQLIQKVEECQEPLLAEENGQPECSLKDEQKVETNSSMPKHEDREPEYLPTRQNQEELCSSQEVQQPSIALMETSTLQQDTDSAATAHPPPPSPSASVPVSAEQGTAVTSRTPAVLSPTRNNRIRLGKATSKHHAKCSVVGCSEEHKTLHRVPVEEDRRAAWVEFIYDGDVPATVGKKLMVCANHFRTDCFANYGQYKAGLAGKLILNEDAVPTLRGVPAEEEHVVLNPEEAGVLPSKTGASSDSMVDLGRRVLQQLQTELEEACQQEPLDLDHLEFITTSKMTLILSLSAHVNFPLSVLNGLEQLIALIQSEINRRSPATVLDETASERGRPRLSVSEDHLQDLIKMDLSVPCIAKTLGVSVKTIHRRKREWGLSIKDTYSSLSDDELDGLVSTIKRQSRNIGCRMVKGRLRALGHRVQWTRVWDSMHRVDSVGILQRMANLGCVVRRTYSVPVPLCLYILTPTTS